MSVSQIHAQAKKLFLVLESFRSSFCSNMEMFSEFKEIINTILAFLIGEIKGDLGGNLVLELKGLVYDADDLLDEIVTNKVQVRVRGVLFRVWSDFILSMKACMIEGKLKDVIQRLECLSEINKKVGVDDITIERLSGDVTIEPRGVNCEIVGREIDKGCVIDMILRSDGDFFVAIVGIGGLGKTALAELVFNDEIIVSEFPLRIWVCLSDFKFDMKLVIGKILDSVFNECVSDNLGLSELEGLLRIALNGKKYLLVLDNVWCEDHVSWSTFKGMFVGAQEGRILVTTRSAMVAQAIGSCGLFKLQGLSEADSWKLFKRVAFEREDERLVEDERILEKCACVPLAIKVVGSLLYAHGLKKWEQIVRASLLDIDQDENRIFPVLKLSFDQLSAPLKRCFVYCASFPKGDAIDKKNLIRLWMAEGYIHPIGSQSLEEVGESYFISLLQKGFFQELRANVNGEITLCKVHDLMHDLAIAAAGDEFQVLSSISSTIDENARHLSIMNVDSFHGTCLPNSKRIRTFLNFSSYTHVSNMLSLLRLKHLRVLGLEFLNFKTLPHIIGEMCHLRYLNLSYNSQLESLPISIVKLVNLQTLVLRDCLELKYLPCDFSKLVNLRHLCLTGCYSLTHMPLGIKNLTNLCELDMFVVGDANSVCSFESLEDLKCLTKLRGELTVRFLEVPGYQAGKSRKTEYLRAKKYLTDIYIHCSKGNSSQHTDDKNYEALLECLEPHPNLKNLVLTEYAGVRFPSWASLKGSEITSLNLVNMCIKDCPRLQHIPILSKLCHLRHLKLHTLENLEFIECDTIGFVKSHSELRSVDSQSFFPSLESLELVNLPKLRAWSRLVELKMKKLLQQEESVIGGGSHSFPAFPRLSELHIQYCPKLTSLPIYENIKQLHLSSFNDALQFVLSQNPLQQHSSPLTTVTIDNVEYLKFLPVESCEHISSLIVRLSDTEWLSLNDVFARDMLSLQSLAIKICGKLKSISGIGWKHLVALQSLQLSNLPNLHLSTMTADGEEDLTPWDSLQGLHHLELDFLPKLDKLPKGIQYLRFLRTFEIRSCHNLEELPEWIACLNELQSLCIENCGELKCLPESMLDLTALKNLKLRSCSWFLIKKYQQPYGEDWPKIQHIPHILIE